MWQYSQSTGALTDANGAVRANGYSGRGWGVNCTQAQDVPNVGPIPQGLWSMAAPVNDPEKPETANPELAHLGPVVIPLVPHQGTDTFQRSGFYVHGDEVNHIGEHLASRGCVVLPPDARHLVWDSGDHILKVTQ